MWLRGHQLRSTDADIAANTGRIAHYQRVVGHVTRDDAASAHHGRQADRHSRQQGGIGTDTGSVLHYRRLHFVGLAAARIAIVREDYVGTEVDVVSDAHAVPQVD